MIKPTKFMNFHPPVFHIYHFLMGKLQTRFRPNNQNKACTKLSKKSENILGRKKRNSPMTSIFGPVTLINSSYNLKSVQIYWSCI